MSDIRAGEIAALYWEDIDLDTGMLFVWLTLVKVGAEYIRQEPKTADNMRRLVMAFTLAACLKHSDFAEKPQRDKRRREKVSQRRLLFQILYGQTLEEYWRGWIFKIYAWQKAG